MSGLKKMNLPVSVCVGLACAVLLTLLLCVPGAMIVNRGILPMSVCPYWAAGAAGLAVLFAALVIAGARKRQTLPTAAALAGGYVVLALLMALIMGGSLAGGWLARLVIAVAVGGFLGAIMSIRQNPHKKRRR